MEEILLQKANQKVVIPSIESNWKLLLWNDDVNDMMFVIIALFDICGLNEQEAVSVMLEAHTHGQAFVKSGNLKELEAIQHRMNERGLSASLVKQVNKLN
jgi:ATP-dependent Clp protease adapter protein ClpS